MSTIRPEFTSHSLSPEGADKATAIAIIFSRALDDIERIVDLKDPRATGGRELAIVKTKLEEAKMFAVRALSVQAENQAVTPG